MDEAQTWRELLGNSIKDIQERQRIADELGVAPITLVRWVNRESTPRRPNLRKLLAALPSQRDVLLPSIKQEIEDFSDEIQENSVGHHEPSFIQPDLYKRVLHARATTPKRLLFSSLSDLILRAALRQLDPERRGMAIIVAACMPPSYGDKVRSLRERVGRGTPPWGEHLEQHAVFLGAESLGGHAVLLCHLETNPRLRDESNLAPGYQGRWEESAVAAPIMYNGAIAGALLVSSAQPNYFAQTHCVLIESYAELVALAFDPADFYDLPRIELFALPAPEEQLSLLSGFAQQVIELMTKTARNGHPLKFPEAELEVWQRLEKTLLQLPQE